MLMIGLMPMPIPQVLISVYFTSVAEERAQEAMRLRAAQLSIQKEKILRKSVSEVTTTFQDFMRGMGMDMDIGTSFGAISDSDEGNKAKSSDQAVTAQVAASDMDITSSVALMHGDLVADSATTTEGKSVARLTTEGTKNTDGASKTIVGGGESVRKEPVQEQDVKGRDAEAEAESSFSLDVSFTQMLEGIQGIGFSMNPSTPSNTNEEKGY